MNRRAAIAAALTVLVVLSGCAVQRTTGPELSTTSPQEDVPVTSSIALPTTTEAPSTTTTTEARPPRVPRFGSTSWVGVEFSIDPETGVRFGAEYRVGEPRHAQIMVDGDPTGIWIWEATYDMQRLILVGEGLSPYLRTITGDGDGDDTTTTTAPPDPTASHDLMLWAITGTSRDHWKVADAVSVELTAGFLADSDVWGDCFHDSDSTSLSQRAFGFVDPDLWNTQYDEEGNYGGSDDIRPLMAFDTGPNGPIEILDPSLVTCRILY